MKPMSDHLTRYPWYAQHQAWLRNTFGVCTHDPGEACPPVQASLRGASLRGADLHGANLHGADLHGANLHGAYLHGAYLHGADLHGAYLHGADLYRAYLHGADLHRADLHGARGIASGGPVGNAGRIVYAVDHDTCIMVQAGCRWEPADDVIAAIERDYADSPAMRDAYIATIRAMSMTLEAARLKGSEE